MTLGTVLVTGGSGSFGRAFVSHLLTHNLATKVCVIARDEAKQERMADDLGNDPRLRFFLGDVRDAERLKQAFRGVNIVIHAAALKRVPALEYNPHEAVLTNVTGSQNVIAAALACGVPRVVGISSDKAVNPLNLYGATKLCMEKLFMGALAYAGESGPRFSCVRYGNVAGSRGSVIPKWRRLIRDGKLIALTDPEATRFWITLDEAVGLVLMALQRMKGSEVFVPKLPTFRMADLAAAMQPTGVNVVGLRAGEKVHESMIGPDEACLASDMGTWYELSTRTHQTADIPAEGYVSRALPHLSIEELAHRLLTVPEEAP